MFFVFKHKHYHAFLIVSGVKKIKTEPISDFSESPSSDSERDPNPKFYNDDMKFPVLEWGMKQGMHTKDAVQILREFPEKKSRQRGSNKSSTQRCFCGRLVEAEKYLGCQMRRHGFVGKSR